MSTLRLNPLPPFPREHPGTGQKCDRSSECTLAWELYHVSTFLFVSVRYLEDPVISNLTYFSKYCVWKGGALHPW